LSSGECAEIMLTIQQLNRFHEQIPVERFSDSIFFCNRLLIELNLKLNYLKLLLNFRDEILIQNAGKVSKRKQAIKAS
jgi:hypothetical protein